MTYRTSKHQTNWRWNCTWTPQLSKIKIISSNDDLYTPSLLLLFRFIRKTVKFFYKNINITMAAYLVRLRRVCFMCSSLPLVRNWVADQFWLILTWMAGLCFLAVTTRTPSEDRLEFTSSGLAPGGRVYLNKNSSLGLLNSKFARTSWCLYHTRKDDAKEGTIKVPSH